MKLFKFTKQSTDKLDHIKTVIHIDCFVRGIKISDSEKIVLAYFILYGPSEDTINLILESNILSFNSLKNTIVKLRKNKFIDKVNKNYVLSKEFDFTLDDSYAVLLKVDN